MRVIAYAPASLVALLTVGAVQAEPGAPPPPLGASRPAAPDQLGGHIVLGGRAALAVPFGELAPGVAQADVASSGLGLGLDAGFGVSRTTVLGLYGDLELYDEAGGCPDCGPSSLGVGAFVRYHLVQGLRFDPWASLGIGYRGFEYDLTGTGASYSGLEWLRVTFGGDWYPTPHLGFGPFVELGAASMLTRPVSEDGGGVNWRFQLGMRVAVDLAGH
jgi:hypothetical protein